MTPFEGLREAAAAAADLGLEGHARSAETLIELIERRLGFPGGVYVLALAGGTGVGKSSVLNALAGEVVSPVRSLRPTTEQPLAWVADESRQELQPLFDWLGIKDVVGHSRDDLSGVAIIDLPDVDSFRVEHRATVDALLPRIDAVAWVVDPEKYDDERLHEYLRQLAPHAERMRFIFNKSDRLDSEQQQMLAEDLRRRLSSAGIETASITTVSAVEGAGVDALRAELNRAADAKAIVAGKLATDAAGEVEVIAAAAGLRPGVPHAPLLATKDREEATARAVDGALALVDSEGVSGQMREAVLHRARRQAGSLLARIISMLSLLTGRKKRKADPAAYLVDWRRRGSLGHILNPVRAALVSAAGAVPAASRPALLKRLGADDAETAVTRALDRSTRKAANELVVPASFLWPVVGFIQLISGAVLLFAIAWYLTIVFGPGGLLVSTVDVPYLGPVPMPLLLLAGSLALSILLGFGVTLHAGWMGKRMGARVAKQIAESVAEAIASVGFGNLDTVEEARRRLARAANLEAISGGKRGL